MSKRQTKFYFFNRDGYGPDSPPGITVSKNPTLPQGDFYLTEYIFQRNGYVALFFVDKDKFSANERESAYQQFMGGGRR